MPTYFMNSQFVAMIGPSRSEIPLLRERYLVRIPYQSLSNILAPARYDHANVLNRPPVQGRHEPG